MFLILTCMSFSKKTLDKKYEDLNCFLSVVSYPFRQLPSLFRVQSLSLRAMGMGKDPFHSFLGV